MLMAGFIGVCFAEPWCNMSRAISGDSLFNDPGVIRLLGCIELAVGVILFGVHLYRD